MANDTTERLARLERLLAERSPEPGRERSESGDARLRAVAADRIGRVASELHARAGRDLDAADVLAMRVLLNDFASAVAHLRALVVATDERLQGCLVTIRGGTRFVQDAIKRDARDGAHPVSPRAQA